MKYATVAVFVCALLCQALGAEHVIARQSLAQLEASGAYVDHVNSDEYVFAEIASEALNTPTVVSPAPGAPVAAPKKPVAAAVAGVKKGNATAKAGAKKIEALKNLKVKKPVQTKEAKGAAKVNGTAIKQKLAQIKKVVATKFNDAKSKAKKANATSAAAPAVVKKPAFIAVANATVAPVDAKNATKPVEQKKAAKAEKKAEKKAAKADKKAEKKADKKVKAVDPKNAANIATTPEGVKAAKKAAEQAKLLKSNVKTAPIKVGSAECASDDDACILKEKARLDKAHKAARINVSKLIADANKKIIGQAAELTTAATTAARGCEDDPISGKCVSAQSSTSAKLKEIKEASEQALNKVKAELKTAKAAKKVAGDVLNDSAQAKLIAKAVAQQEQK